MSKAGKTPTLTSDEKKAMAYLWDATNGMFIGDLKKMYGRQFIMAPEGRVPNEFHIPFYKVEEVLGGLEQKGMMLHGPGDSGKGQRWRLTPQGLIATADIKKKMEADKNSVIEADAGALPPEGQHHKLAARNTGKSMSL